jgi:hypothetical protein
VIGYEPTDEQIEAFIYEIAKSSPRDIPAEEAFMVADYVLNECRRIGIRPSVRMIMDKALPDYCQWREGMSQSHWKDLVCSDLQELAIVQVHPLQDVSRKERTESERRLVLSLCEEFPTGRERVKAWTAKTGKGKSAFYRRYEELKAQGLIGGYEDLLADEVEVSPPSRSPEPNGGTTMRLVW